jgi:hypothetical protein
MAVAVEMNFAGGTLAQYDQVISLLGLTPGGAGPAGQISHWIAATDTGTRAVDVWESKEQYEAFARERIGPLTRQAGVPGPPEVTYYEVHSYFTPG